MKDKKTLVIIVLVFALIVGGAYLLYTRLGDRVDPNRLDSQTTQNDNTVVNENEVANLAPDFAVYDANGKQVFLSDYFGKPIVLNFWASWGPPGKAEMPDFQDKYLELGDEVQFLMVNMTDGSRETVESAQEFIKDSKYTFPVLFDSDSVAARAYSIYSIPTTYFIDSKGNIVNQATGSIDAATLQQGIELIK